ncbi:MAG: GSCFA domain-containing protein [Bacteroidales bacterium]|nr:GSCFA domain-containing protein [Bacteroidales bacterium]
MHLSTDVKIQPIEQRIVYGDKLLFLGSCFADEIGNICKGLGFDALVNPFGVLFNPASISQSVERLESGKNFTKDDVIEVGGEFFCTFNHNTEFWNPSPEKLLETVNSSLNSARQHFMHAKWIVISLGTSWIYRHKQRGLIVSNCHKLPSQLFQREFLTTEQSTELLSQLVEKHKDKKFIFTISPLRHLKDGLHENQISKAALLLAVDEICKHFGNAHYFPAYEILLDELRDYRFYKEDMIHPTEQAVRYIWERFTEFAIAEGELPAMKQAQELKLMLQHKVFFPESEAFRKFEKLKNEKIQELISHYSNIKLENL